ncbi:glucokinase [Pseudorhodobacter ferrugineus]|uniref:glucokinase n=1 Tax=Pseudorhodobacter ferrugineus TaxID=77008 RepID=UPI0003B3246D|nr:glucokinase [Pseudorhodobacter ferrugineus]
MPLPLKSRLSLVADIGGTNTRVALADGKVLQEGTVRRFRNADFPGLETILRAYLEALPDVECGGACVAVAGPVAQGVATMTNLDWTIDGPTLTRATGAEMVAILNDLQAQGHALGYIAPENLRPVIGQGEPDPIAAKLVIGVGTGFNAAPVHETPWGRVVAASECGHVNMPVRNEADLRLAHFVETAHGFPGVEDVLSGRGLERLFAFVSKEAGSPSEATAAAIMGGLANEAEGGFAPDVARLFTRLLGAEAGNLALTHLPFGGIYLCGGVSRAIAPYLTQMGFEAAFRDKGRFSGFMKNFSVSVVEDDYAALTGCAVYLDQGTQG